VSSFRESISAFGPHKHKIAVSTASAAALACAVFGSSLGQTPAANAAASKPAASAAQAAAVRRLASLPTRVASSPAAATTTAAPKAPAPETKSAAPAPATTAAKPAAPVAAPAPVDPYAGLSAYQIAERIVPSGEFAAFAWIVTHESGWDVHATNPSSGAYGLGQALPATKMAPYGSDYLNNPVTQIKWALAYMNERYGSPNAAQVWWENHGWY
jgi:Transglycosylase SLT domain